MKKFLIIDDDLAFCEALRDNFIKRGFNVAFAHGKTTAIDTTKSFVPDAILLDLKLKDESGLELIPSLLKLDKAIKIVVLTGYANINTAIEAIKLGAIHYLSKPVATDEIIAAFDKQQGNPKTPVAIESIKLNVAEREHIINAFLRNKQNISATARELGMHRRTLQRKLDKLR